MPCHCAAEGFPLKIALVKRKILDKYNFLASTLHARYNVLVRTYLSIVAPNCQRHIGLKKEI